MNIYWFWWVFIAYHNNLFEKTVYINKHSNIYECTQVAERLIFLFKKCIFIEKKHTKITSGEQHLKSILYLITLYLQLIILQPWCRMSKRERKRPTRTWVTSDSTVGSQNIFSAFFMSNDQNCSAAKIMSISLGADLGFAKNARKYDNYGLCLQ